MTVTVQATWVATLVDEWVRAGVSDAVIAPGSRSTPLTLALARDGRVRTHVHLDERAAGFFALGIGLETGRPAVVVTTSGTAAVEVHPSVVEASLARVPMLVCTADRPPELHGVAAPQTIDQAHLFGRAVRWFVEPGPAEGLPASSWRSLASRMVAEALAGPAGPGPVHANLAFRDPLVGDPGELPPGRAGGAAWHLAGSGSGSAAPPLASPPGRAGEGAVTGGVRGVVVAGAGAPAELADAGWPVLADPRSGLRGAPGAVAAFDGILRAPGVPTPDVVVRCGQPPASKVLAQWLAELPASTEQLVVDPHGGWPDPERRAARRLTSLPALGPADPAHRDWWLAAERAAQTAIDATLGADAAGTEPGLLRRLTRELPDDTTIFVSSSMPIRDIEWFGAPSSAHRVVANRGANGIDGVVATALGVAAGRPGRPVVAVVGDLAFLYDTSALLWATTRDVALTIVVVDNAGGGIFSFLPQRTGLDGATFERYFGTPHAVDVAELARAHGIEVLRSVDDVLAARGRGVRVAVARSDRDRNVEVHERLQQAIVAAVTAAPAPTAGPAA